MVADVSSRRPLTNVISCIEYPLMDEIKGHYATDDFFKFPFESLSKGESMLKWTTLDHRSGLGESDPKIYTNFEFYEIEIHKHSENI